MESHMLTPYEAMVLGRLRDWNDKGNHNYVSESAGERSVLERLYTKALVDRVVVLKESYKPMYGYDIQLSGRQVIYYHELLEAIMADVKSIQKTLRGEE